MAGLKFMNMMKVAWMRLKKTNNEKKNKKPLGMQLVGVLSCQEAGTVLPRSACA